MKSQFDLDGKIVVVTGGAGLIGQSFCSGICSAGGVPVIADINPAAAEAAAGAILSKHPDAAVDTVEMDISSDDSIGRALEYVTEKHGRIDALINNAYPRNKNYGRAFFDVEYADFCENLGLNLGGYFLTSKIFARFFMEQGHGNIINISSIYGVMAPRFEIYDGTPMTMPVEYAAIKSGVIHLTKYMAKYLRDSNVRVNALSPGGIFDHQPSAFVDAYREHCLNKGMLDKDDISGTLVFLLSDASKYVNGQNLIVDDGFVL